MTLYQFLYAVLSGAFLGVASTAVLDGKHAYMFGAGIGLTLICMISDRTK